MTQSAVGTYNKLEEAAFHLKHCHMVRESHRLKHELKTEHRIFIIIRRSHRLMGVLARFALMSF
jgi:hypothetical protein